MYVRLHVKRLFFLFDFKQTCTSWQSLVKISNTKFY
jgi:hypothetical protein